MATALPLTVSPLTSSASFLNNNNFKTNSSSVSLPTSKYSFKRFKTRAIKGKTEEIKTPSPSSSSSSSSGEDLTKKYGLEAGLWKVGISTDEIGEKVGTFALAYAAHKAASPIRFPTTVPLTPIVARWIGNKDHKEK